MDGQFISGLEGLFSLFLSVSLTPNQAAEGEEVENKHTILDEIDQVLGKKSPPALEYIYVESNFKALFSEAIFPFYNSGSAANPYGHSALRYTLKDGSSWVANISGSPNSQLLTLSKANNYIFGRSEEQGGVYQRAMRGFRIENVPPEGIEKVHNFFLEVQRREKEGTAKYALVWGNTIPLINKLSSVENGNCSYWVSCGLVKAGVLPTPSMWPKILFVSLYLRFFTKNFGKQNFEKSHLMPKAFFSPENVKIIAYRKQAAPANDPMADSWISPSFFFSPTGRVFRALERFADVVVSTPLPKNEDGDKNEKSRFRATIDVVSKPFRPFSTKE